MKKLKSENAGHPPIAAPEGVKFRMETITPDRAEQILNGLKTDESYKNRPLSDAKVESYAKDMRNGQWIPTHQGLAYYEDGTLFDGQHRLWAIYYSGVSITMMVSYGWPRTIKAAGMEMSPQDAVDRGRTRSVSQQMGLNGRKYASHVSAANRAIGSICTGKWNISLSYAQTLFIDEIYSDSIYKLIELANGKVSRTPAHILGPMTMYYHKKPELAKIFWESFLKLEGLIDGNPVLTLVRFIQNFNGKGGGHTRQHLSLAVCNALKAYDSNRELRRVTSSNDGAVWMETIQGEDSKRIIRSLTDVEQPVAKKG